MTAEHGNSLAVPLGIFIKHYPKLYHMAESGTWDSIREHGLLSTSSLLDLFGVIGEERFVIESERRSTSVKITHPVYGTATIRDQKPMQETALRTCLRGMTPRDWYEHLNKRVFFWLTAERLTRLITAKAYRDSEHCIITVDTQQMIERHHDDITLSPINSGSTIYTAQPRGAGTFLPFNKYPFEMRRKLRGVKDAVAELAVNNQVTDISEFTLKVEHVRGREVLNVLYERSF